MRIAYLVPEFPGQTHIFWREIDALRRCGIEARLISSRHPPRKLFPIVGLRWAKRRWRYSLGAPAERFRLNLMRLHSSQ
jgi:hypothetical protein